MSHVRFARRCSAVSGFVQAHHSLKAVRTLSQSESNVLRCAACACARALRCYAVQGARRRRAQARR
jgi:hypothetical protein